MTRLAASPFASALASSQRWVADVAAELGTDNIDVAYRVTRAWLQIVRDRLPVIESAHFAAQLPELLRGVYYEGWQPAHVPAKYDLDEFTVRFAAQAGVAQADVRVAARAVSQAFDRHMSGHLATAIGHLPPDVRSIVSPRRPAPLHELVDD